MTLNRRLYGTGFMSIVFISAILFSFMQGCGSSDEGEVIKPPENNGETGEDDDDDVQQNPDSTVIDYRNTDASIIPDEYVEAVKNNLHVVYQHTSHGSQIISGMNALRDYAPYSGRYSWSDDGSSGLDLDDYGIMAGYHDLSTEDSEDANGDTPWAIATRELLDNPANYHVNVIMWSWCSIHGHNIERYIRNMEKLIAEYGAGGTGPRAADHPVEFVFMTGHTQGEGEDGFVAQAAAQIRQHCVDNGRWLIDYYSIECFDPDGNYFGDLDVDDDLSYSGGNWAEQYLDRHPGSLLEVLVMGDGESYSGCPSCAHSEEGEGQRESTLNCVLKGQAVWHLFARIAGLRGSL